MKKIEVDVTVYNMFTIEQVMTRNLVTISPDSSIKEVAEILAVKSFTLCL
jgi:CBS domain-containing protein